MAGESLSKWVARFTGAPLNAYGCIYGHDFDVPTRRPQPITPASDDFDFFLSRSPFRVPRYQRAFDWDTEEVRDYARDVRGLADHRIKGRRDRHFFGAIVSIFHEADDYYEVVDGQQRLTVEMLCLDELRRRWLELADRATAARRASVTRRARQGARRAASRVSDAGSLRLRLSKRDTRFFSELLEGTARKPGRNDDQSHRRLWSARETVRDELFTPLLRGARSYAVTVKRLKAVEDALLVDGYVVHLYTNDRGQAYRLFSILNDRGRPLSDGALLRTHTLAVLENYPAQQDAAEADWDAILRIGDTFVDQFLAAYYVSHVGVRVPTGDMFDKFRDRFLAHEVASPRAATALQQTIARLREETVTFSRIRGGDWPFDDSKIRAWDRDRLKRLVGSLRHNLAHPLLLAVARHGTEHALRDLILTLEPFVFRYINVVNATPTRLAPIYYDHAKRVRQTGQLDKNGLRNSLRKLVRSHAPDDVFVALLRDQLRYARTPQRRQLIKHFLTTIDDYEDWFKAGATGRRRVTAKTSVYDLDQVNIEHVYPQNPKRPDAGLEELKHALGNLTPLDDRDGGQAGNQGYSAKKPIYAKSRFSITKDLAAVSQWDEAAVGDRFTYYADRAKKVFVVA